MTIEPASFTPESKSGTKVAQQIATHYAGLQEVAAVVLGGSVARGIADPNSDLDIFIFCHDFPSEALRAEVVASVQGEGWKQHHNKLDHGILRDCFRGAGHRIDLEHVRIDNFEAVVDDVLSDHDTDRLKQGLLGGLLDSHSLYDSGIVEVWKSRLSDYPDGLQRRVVEENLYVDPLWIPEIYVRKRDDHLYLLDAMSRVGNCMLGLLHGLNRMYQPGEYKRVQRILSQFDVAPANIVKRWRAVFEIASVEVVTDLEAIVLEIFDLVEGCRPDVDVVSARTGFTTDTDTE